MPLRPGARSSLIRARLYPRKVVALDRSDYLATRLETIEVQPRTIAELLDATIALASPAHGPRERLTERGTPADLPWLCSTAHD